MEPLKPLQLVQLAQRPAPAAPAAGSGTGFAQALHSALQGANQAQLDAQRIAARYQAGDPSVSLEQSMISLQTASLSFQAVVQTRNKLVQAYQDIMNMQV